MKNLYIVFSITIAILIVIIVILFQKLNECEKKIVTSKDNTNIKFDTSFTENNFVSKIELAMAKKLVKKYVNDAPGIPRSVFFQGDDLTKFRSYINDSNVLGLRVYLGRYYDNDGESDAATYNIKNYILNLFESVKQRNDYLRDYDKKITTVILATTNKEGYPIISNLINLGGLCPPKCKQPDSYNPDNDELYK